MRTATCDDVEEALLLWFTSARNQDIPISGPILKMCWKIADHPADHKFFLYVTVILNTSFCRENFSDSVTSSLFADTQINPC